jgi:Zn-dependent metalloprotease
MRAAASACLAMALATSAIAQHLDLRSWTLDADATTGRPRRLIGGAMALPTDLKPEEAALRFLAENAAALGVDPPTLRQESSISADSGRLRLVHFEIAPHGVPVVGARVSLAISSGKLIYVHLVGTAPVDADPNPRIDAAAALDIALRAAQLAESDLDDDPDPPRLVFLPEGATHRLAWEVTLIERARPRRRLARVDARTRDLISLTDETVSACNAPTPHPGRRALGGVRPERADEPEREELLPFVTAGGAVAGRDGVFAADAPEYAGTLDGPGASVDCVGCSTPAQPLAPADVSGEVDFGSGGTDSVGNGLATPADRAAYFHVESARRQAARWLAIPFTSARVRVHSNVDATCNAYWDGRSLNFFRSGDGCANTGEIRDVMTHEWGHGLDQNDGIPPPGLAIDGATGEAAADIVAMLRSRDACIGESFHQDGSGPSAACSGVRDLDEHAAGHQFGAPATLSTANVSGICPPSGFYRGPLGREGHCEGQIFGQAFWHLVQDLLTGVSYADGTPLPMDPLSPEQAWDVAEHLYYASRGLMASYAPTRLQAIGPSAYDAFLVADDEGDGVGNGTPHAAAIHDAFAHHGMEESPLAPTDTPDCTPPTEPVVSVAALGDPDSGLPALHVSWSDVGAIRYHVLRQDDSDDAYLLLETRGPGAGTLVDRGVLPGRTYSYRVVAESAAGCLSPGTPMAGSPGALLRIVGLRVDDAPPRGNGNGRLEDPETTDVYVDLANEGAQPARNLRVSLSATDPRVVVVGPASIAYGSLAPGARADAPAPFQVRAGSGAPRHLFLVASAESDDGCLRDARAIEVASRDVRLDAWRIDDSPPLGDGDAAWREGESVRLIVDLRNEGLLDATPVDATIAFAGPPVPGITIVDGTASWGLVAAGGVPVTSTAPHFTLRAAAGLPSRTRVPLMLSVRIGGVPHASFPITLTVGAFPAPTQEWLAGDRIWGTPVVVPLEDTDGDGVITACDVPAVVALGETANGEAGLFAFHGDGGAPLWSVLTSDDCVDDTIVCTLAQYAPAAGDLDGDGDNEIVVVSDYGDVTAFTSTGGIFWTNPNVAVFGSAAPQICDVDADGSVEVVVGSDILDGVTGALETRLPAAVAGRVLVADLDLDGKMEIITSSGSGATFHADGTPYPASFPSFEGFGGVANLDDERHPEVVMVHDTNVTAKHFDGSPMWERSDLPWPIAPSVPCFGDLDGDGRAEVALSTEDEMWALDDDGSTLWVAPVNDHTGMFASCAVFDFDGDSLPEVIYRDSTNVQIFDGKNGDVLWQVPARSSTLWETPVVADVDGDGSAEIVLSFTAVGPISTPQSLRVYGSPQWLPARSVWNQEAYSITNVEDDGGIPRLPTPSWLASNSFKGQSGNGPCACAQPQPSFTVARPDYCTGTTACFSATAVGIAPEDMSWDFGDASPPVTGDSPCHQFSSPGDYPVRLTVGLGLGCPQEAGRIVRIHADLAAPFTMRPACLGKQTCVSSAASGGAPPYEVAWDFGDGSPQVTGDATCHDFPAGGSWTITSFVRDDEGCLAESSQDLSIFDPATLPEVSPRASASPLLVHREGASRLRLDFEDTGFEVGVYQGFIQWLRPSGYTHESIDCRILGGVTFVALPPFDAYFLAVSSACDPRIEGSYGFDSFLRARPSASDLGLPTCP